MVKHSELNALLKSIRRIARAVDITSRRLDREFGLTLPQLIVLGCIRDLGEVTSRAISVEADLSAPTVVGILDKLEAKRLIERYRSLRDRRIVHTRLTVAGVQLLSKAPSPLGDEFAETFGKLNQVTRRQTIGALSRVADLVSAVDERALNDE